MPQHKSKNLPQELTSERGKTHGDWEMQAGTAHQLKTIIRNSVILRKQTTNHMLPAHRLEALEMIAVKMSRILWGNDDEPDHWDDIGGYSFLGKEGRTK